MVEISVIIPAYNAIDYMDESLDSIINQSFKDLEIICVDDGSTDNTLERLEYYASKDSRIQVYTQENQGPGGATNTGLSKAKGKYKLYWANSTRALSGYYPIGSYSLNAGESKSVKLGYHTVIPKDATRIIATTGSLNVSDAYAVYTIPTSNIFISAGLTAS